MITILLYIVMNKRSTIEYDQNINSDSPSAKCLLPHPNDARPRMGVVHSSADDLSDGPAQRAQIGR